MISGKVNIRSYLFESGFALIEILVVLSIIVLLIVVSYSSLINSNKNQALANDVAKAVSFLDRARSLTLDSQNASQYGVHLEQDSLTLFKGSSFSSTDPSNFTESLNKSVTISSYSLNDGGADVVFERLTGKTEGYGTVTFSLVSDNTKYKVITISNTGLVEQN